MRQSDREQRAEIEANDSSVEAQDRVLTRAAAKNRPEPALVKPAAGTRLARELAKLDVPIVEDDVDEIDDNENNDDTDSNMEVHEVEFVIDAEEAITL